MRDTELYESILGLTPPWRVVSVELDVKGQAVTVRVDAGAGPFGCLECEEVVPGYDKKLRRWRHLDTCQFVTWVEAEVPRVECARHGVKQIRVPWAERGSQFTMLFERLAIDLLLECSVSGTADLLRISWDEAWGIKERGVRRGLARRSQEDVRHIGVDEKAVAKRHRYLTIVADLDRNRVLYLSDGRKAESLDEFWQGLRPEQQTGIKAVAMDMWEPYIR
ncbi:MAG: transposase, partial [Candidatus Bipolaricaulota bacterium]